MKKPDCAPSRARKIQEEVDFTAWPLNEWCPVQSHQPIGYAGPSMPADQPDLWLMVATERDIECYDYTSPIWKLPQLDIEVAQSRHISYGQLQACDLCRPYNTMNGSASPQRVQCETDPQILRMHPIVLLMFCRSPTVAKNLCLGNSGGRFRCRPIFIRR